MREREIEQYLVKEVKKIGGLAYKLTSSGNRGLPDRLCILHGVIAFIELKAPGKRPSDLQQLHIDHIKKRGHIALWIDSKAGVDAFITWYHRFKGRYVAPPPERS